MTEFARYNPHARHTVVLDWDGTLVPSAWPEKPTVLLPGAIEALHALHKAGFHLTVNSARLTPFDPHTHLPRDPGLVAAEYQYVRSTLDRAGLTFVDIWQLPGKPPGSAYVDDRAYHYNGRKGAWKAMAEKLIIGLGQEPPMYAPFDQAVANGHKKPAPQD